ncbi:hypothetical protein GCM10011594_21220 [Nakamurella endophytica]|uniref:Methyltransferase domain-containing protein n=1 Tax=Nakamurella endophytica TaxID=1748367 RepID=A0A917SYA7_9ACTN|nr:hypothetical protein GCM10011594_21220 [Nakamurella endophytica]
MDGGHHGGPGGAPHTHDTQADGALADILDLDGRTFPDFLPGVTDWIAAGTPAVPRRIVDLGAGTGTGTMALLHRFPEATVVAVDSSAEMLDRLRAGAARAGYADRVETREADLDQGWPDTGPVDLVWASSSLHHMADPDRVLADVLRTLTPDGVLAAVEMDDMPWFLQDAADPALAESERRCRAELTRRRQEDLPHLGDDWGSRLRADGFAVLREHTWELAVRGPLSAEATRYAELTLRRIRAAVADRLTAAELAPLDRLLDGDGPAGSGGLAGRDDVVVRSRRLGWLAGR